MKPPGAGSQDSSGSARPAVLAPVAYAVWSFSTGFSLGPSVRELHRPDPLSIARRHMPLIVPVFMLFSSLMLGGGVRLWRTARRRWMLVSAWLLFPIAFLILAGTVTRYPLNLATSFSHSRRSCCSQDLALWVSMSGGCVRRRGRWSFW